MSVGLRFPTSSQSLITTHRITALTTSHPNWRNFRDSLGTKLSQQQGTGKAWGNRGGTFFGRFKLDFGNQFKVGITRTPQFSFNFPKRPSIPVANEGPHFALKLYAKFHPQFGSPPRNGQFSGRGSQQGNYLPSLNRKFIFPGSYSQNHMSQKSRPKKNGRGRGFLDRPPSFPHLIWADNFFQGIRNTQDFFRRLGQKAGHPKNTGTGAETSIRPLARAFGAISFRFTEVIGFLGDF